MFCPNCKSEYREGFTICSGCNVPLVDILPQEEKVISRDTKNKGLITNNYPQQLDVKTILAVAFLYTVITSCFSLIIRLAVVFEDKNIIIGMGDFLRVNWAWMAITAGIIVLLYMFGKKLNSDFSSILHNTSIWMAAGILVSINGLIYLSGSVVSRVLYIISSIKVIWQGDINTRSIFERNIIIDIVSLLLILCQVAFGIYMIMKSKNKNYNLTMENQ
ncbi:MAG: hypothetical protein Q8920_17495 [Bacillota bacterium]|nr:hypothetical protein [Bacillota bacterium]